MRVGDIMTRQLKTIAPGDTAEEAWTLMRLHQVHHLVVVEDGHVVGVLSDRDVGGRRGTSLRRNHTVAELMAAHPVTTEPTVTIRRAANIMRGRSIGCLVVTKAARPVGIVTTSDLLELVGRGLDRGADTSTRRPLSHRVPHRKTNEAFGVW
jgi:acetoin utilization protein AcuB